MIEHSRQSPEEIRYLKKSLQWQCRRGIKEIELLLIPFLEEEFESQDAQTREHFVRLLEQADLDIFEWFSGRGKPEDKDMESIVNVILSCVAIKHQA